MSSFEARVNRFNTSPDPPEFADAFQKIRDYKETHKDAAEGSVEKIIINKLQDLRPILESESDFGRVGLARQLGVTVAQLREWYKRNNDMGGRRRRTMKGRRKMRKTRRRY